MVVIKEKRGHYFEDIGWSFKAWFELGRINLGKEWQGMSEKNGEETWKKCKQRINYTLSQQNGHSSSSSSLAPLSMSIRRVLEVPNELKIPRYNTKSSSSPLSKCSQILEIYKMSAWHCGTRNHFPEVFENLVFHTKWPGIVVDMKCVLAWQPGQ
jgi:hypothetical protein